MKDLIKTEAYVCENFGIHELVYPEIYRLYEYHQKIDLLWFLLNKKSTMAVDDIRNFINGSCTINDWFWDGRFKESGLRNPTSTTGADLSTHKIGSGFDLKFNVGKWNPESLREYMKEIGCFKAGFLDRTDELAKPFLNITRIEWLDDMSWFHLDNSVHGNADRSICIVYG